MAWHNQAQIFSFPSKAAPMDFLLDPQLWLVFGMLTLLEIVLGIDNIIFISILVGRLPAAQRNLGRRLGLAFALVTRLALLFSLSWIMGLTTDLFSVMGQGFSGRDLALLAGGLFLLWKAAHEIFVEVEAKELGAEAQAAQLRQDQGALQGHGGKLFWGIILQIALIDIVFSIDSIITAVGMVNHLPVMAAAIIAAVVVMMFAVGPIGEFIDAHPSIKVLALSFLVMVGMALTAEAFDFHIPKGYIYASMCFSMAVEMLNIRARKKRLAAKAA